MNSNTFILGHPARSARPGVAASFTRKILGEQETLIASANADDGEVISISTNRDTISADTLNRLKALVLHLEAEGIITSAPPTP